MMITGLEFREKSPISSTIYRSSDHKRLINHLLKLQIDFEFAAWQIMNLFYAPNRVFRSFQFRKKTKDYWARDDPGFYVLFAIFVIASALLTFLAIPTPITAYSLVKFCLYSLIIECLASSLLISAVFWIGVNRVLLKNRTIYGTIEWAYCLDVHLNALLVVRFIFYVAGLPLIYLSSGNPSIPRSLVCNFAWLVAYAAYNYLSYLGLKAVPLLKKPRKPAILTSILMASILWLVVSVAGINLTRVLIDFYTRSVL